MVDDDDDSWKDKIYQIPPGGIDYGSRDYFRHRDNRWERRGKGAPADPAILRQEEVAGQSLNYDSYSDLVLEMLNGMRWNLIWYLPVCAYFILRVFWQNVELYWESVVSTYRHWRFFLLWEKSPAFGVCAGAIHLLLLAPWAILLIPIFFRSESTYYRRRYLWSFLLAGAIYGVCCLLVWVVIGSWPFLRDKSGELRIRMIPFVACDGCKPIQ